MVERNKMINKIKVNLLSQSVRVTPPDRFGCGSAGVSRLCDTGDRADRRPAERRRRWPPRWPGWASLWRRSVACRRRRTGTGPCPASRRGRTSSDSVRLHTGCCWSPPSSPRRTTHHSDTRESRFLYTLAFRFSAPSVWNLLPQTLLVILFTETFRQLNNYIIVFDATPYDDFAWIYKQKRFWLFDLLQCQVHSESNRLVHGLCPTIRKISQISDQ